MVTQVDSSFPWWKERTLSEKQMWMFSNMMRAFPSGFTQKWNSIDFICDESQNPFLPWMDWCPPMENATMYMARTLVDPECSVRYNKGNTNTCSKYCEDKKCGLVDRLNDHSLCGYSDCEGVQETILQGLRTTTVPAVEWWAQDRENCQILFNPRSKFMTASHQLSKDLTLPDVFVQDYTETCLSDLGDPGDPGDHSIVNPVVHYVWSSTITCFYALSMGWDGRKDKPLRLGICQEKEEGIPMHLLFTDVMRTEQVWELCFSPYLWNRCCGNDKEWYRAIQEQDYKIV
jgi:hypothetical protein